MKPRLLNRPLQLQGETLATDTLVVLPTSSLWPCRPVAGSSANFARRIARSLRRLERKYGICRPNQRVGDSFTALQS